MLSYGDLPPPDPRITDVSWKWPACTHFPFRYHHHHHHHHAVYHETQISFCIRRSVCTDCSDRSHPSHIGFVAGNRIHVHLCCYYRAIGVFVYWLTKSTDIESDNRHYFCPVPDPFSNPLPPPPSPLSRSRPRNAAHGTDRSAKYRGGARETRAWTQSSSVCVRVCTQPKPELRFEGRGERGGTTPKTSVHSDRVSKGGSGSWLLP